MGLEKSSAPLFVHIPYQVYHKIISLWSSPNWRLKICFLHKSPFFHQNTRKERNYLLVIYSWWNQEQIIKPLWNMYKLIAQVKQHFLILIFKWNKRDFRFISNRLYCWKTEWQMLYFICTTLDHQALDVLLFLLIDPSCLNLQRQSLGHFSWLGCCEVALFWIYRNNYMAIASLAITRCLNSEEHDFRIWLERCKVRDVKNFIDIIAPLY